MFNVKKMSRYLLDVFFLFSIEKKPGRFEGKSGKTQSSKLIVIYTISGIKAILQDSSVKIADNEGVSPSSSVITRVSCNMF
jgi:hypothetical protein